MHGLLMIVSPWNENKIIKVNNKPITVTLLKLFKNTFSNQSIPLFLIKYFRDKYPATKGTTIYKTTDKIIVL